MTPRRRLLLSLVLLGLLPSAHALAREPAPAPSAAAASATMRGDAQRPARTAHWQRAEVYFGLGRRDADDATAFETRWQAFLDEEVTPRFPDGFSVLDAYGQWQRQDNRQIERLNSKLLVVLFQGAKQRRDLDALRAAWKQRTGDESVLLSITPAEVSF